VVVLGSSSSGNSTLVEADGGSILVDAGFSCKELTRRISAVGADVRDLVAIVLTHEHTDHVSGARVLSRRYDLPVYGTRGTLTTARRYLGDVDLRPKIVQETFKEGVFSLTLLPVPHDATEPSAVRLDVDGRSVLVATDLGHFPWSLIETAQDMHGLVLESNHDVRMLKEGPYPVYLKARIRGPRGHLSNAESAVALRALLGPQTMGVLLGHLSQRNNTEEIALATVLDGVPEAMHKGVKIKTTSPNRSEELVL
jgi:phosphoribosyl 1,2-cyclic phosphodiesterase